VSKICEIGEQGGFDLVQHEKVWNRTLGVDQLNSLTMKDELPNEKAIIFWL
jgi:hypothetical protein